MRKLGCKRFKFFKKLDSEAKCYEKAEEEYYKDIDINIMLKKIRDSHNFKNLYCSPKQLLMLKFGASNLFGSSESDCQSDPLEKLFEKTLTRKKSNGDPSLVSIFALGSVARVLSEFTNKETKLSKFDK